MKKYLFLFFIICNFILLSAQTIGNKVNIGVGASFGFPINQKNVHEDNFNYPSLYGNYGAGASGFITVDFNIKDNFSAGFEIGKTYFTNWKGNQEIFVLYDPTLKMSVYSISLLFYPKQFQFKNIPVLCGVYAAPVFAVQQLKWSKINQYTDDEIEFPNSEKLNLPGFRLGLEYSHSRINSFKICSRIYYQYLQCNSNYYTDRAFNSVNISILIKYDLFKNRYFKYE